MPEFTVEIDRRVAGIETTRYRVQVTQDTVEDAGHDQAAAAMAAIDGRTLEGAAVEILGIQTRPQPDEHGLLDVRITDAEW